MLATAEEILAGLRLVVFDRFCLQVTMLASLVLVIYDALICIDTEVEHVWRTGDASFKIFWALLRYSPVLGLICGNIAVASEGLSQSRGQAIVRLSIATWCLLFGAVLLSQVAFVARVYALYGRARRILFVFAPLLIGHAVLSAYVLTRDVGHLPSVLFKDGVPHFPDLLSECHILVVWSYQFILDGIIFGLTMMKSRQLMKHDYSGLVRMLLRDGTGYFSLMLLNFAMNIFVTLFSKDGMSTRTTTMSTTLFLILSQRITLNLRAAPRTMGRDTSSAITARCLTGLDWTDNRNGQLEEGPEWVDDTALTRP